MIFVTLGTQKFQLNRLLKIMDSYIEQGLITQSVIAQIGNSDYIPKYYSFKHFLDKTDFDQYVKQSSLVITHSGVGSIIAGVNAGKPVIVFPRLMKYQEHVDDHQLDIARAFEKKGFVKCCYDQDNLMDIINDCSQFQFQHYVSQRDHIVQIVSNYISATERKQKL